MYCENLVSYQKMGVLTTLELESIYQPEIKKKLIAIWSNYSTRVK